MSQGDETPDARRVPRPAIERLQAALAQPVTTDPETAAAPRGRRKFRDQPPIERRRQRGR